MLSRFRRVKRTAFIKLAGRNRDSQEVEERGEHVTSCILAGSLLSADAFKDRLKEGAQQHRPGDRKVACVAIKGFAALRP